MEQRDKVIILHIVGISPLEPVSNVQKLKEQMKSEMDGMNDDDQKMIQKFLQPLLTVVSQAMEYDIPPLRPNLASSLILDEEQFHKLDLHLGDFITFEIKKLDRSKLSDKKPEFSSETNPQI